MKNEALIRYRKQAKMTQTEVAEKIGLSRTGYANYEYGQGEATPESLRRLAELYGLSLAETAMFINEVLLNKSSDEIQEEIRRTVFNDTINDDKVEDPVILNLAKYLRTKGYYVQIEEFDIWVSYELTRAKFNYAEFLEWDSHLESTAFSFLFKHRIKD